MNGSKIGLIIIILTMAMSCTPASVKMKPLDPVINDNVTTLYDLYADNPEKFKGREADAQGLFTSKKTLFSHCCLYMRSYIQMLWKFRPVEYNRVEKKRRIRTFR
jgi:hypothetical protein